MRPAQGREATRVGENLTLTADELDAARVARETYADMRAIKAHMMASDFESVPGDIRGMKRLWPDVPGLQKRREREALLFERELRAQA